MTEEKLQTLLHEALARAGAEVGEGEAEFTVPPDASHGDLTTNAVLVFAKKLGADPRKFAEDVARALRGAPGATAVDVAGPGFVNVRLGDDVIFNAITEALRRGDDYGRSKLGRGANVQVEFVSANPTGPLNAVNARAAAYGDALSRLLEFTGHVVEREFYVCNVGTQMDLLGQSVRARLLELLGEKGKQAEIPEGGYRGEYVKTIANALHEQSKISAENGHEKIGQAAAEEILAGQKRDLEGFRVRFDNWFYEDSLYRENKIPKTLDILASRGISYEKDRALWLRTTAAGDDEDRVVVRADGRPTYFMTDIAYHLDKYERGFAKVVDVLGPDHYGHVKKLQAMAALLGLPGGWLEVIISQQVNLLEGGEKVKMSKRAGALVTMREVMDKIGVDAARFFFLMRSPSSHLDFDFELARKQTPENPVYYAQYCHARVESIKGEAGEERAAAPPEKADLGELDLPEERLMARAIWEFPKAVEAAATRREPHRLTTYATGLAALFHNYYHHHRILQAPTAAKAQARLALARAVGQTVKNALRLLGVSAPSHM